MEDAKDAIQVATLLVMGSVAAEFWNLVFQFKKNVQVASRQSRTITQKPRFTWCLNGGACTDGNNEYTGICPSGFTGATCEISTDECDPNPCQNGGTCVVEVDGFSCTRPPGFSGDICEPNDDDCIPNPCLKWRYMHGWNQMTCICPSGFTEPKCETNTDECDPNPCLNGGTCNDEVDGFSCNCPVGYSGDRCEINDNPTGGSSCEDEISLLADWFIITDSNENGPRTTFRSYNGGDVSGWSSWYSLLVQVEEWWSRHARKRLNWTRLWLFPAPREVNVIVSLA